MKSEIYYGDLGRSDDLEFLIKDHINHISRLTGDRSIKTKVWVDHESKAQNRGLPCYSTSIEVIRPHGKSYYVKKLHFDFNKSLKKAFRSLQNLIRKK